MGSNEPPNRQVNVPGNKDGLAALVGGFFVVRNRS